MENFTANNVWMMICTALVFFMHLGFGLLEAGLTRQKNTLNILFKNIFIITSGLLLYYIIGFNLMYPGDFNGFLGSFVPGIAPPENGMTPEYASGGYTWWTDFLFQGMFAATAATIVSGAVAERIKIGPFMIFVVLYVGLVYPIAGSWQWGGGFLSTLGNEVNEAGEILKEAGFYDFAGSTLVHSVGGWAALVAVWLLGARIGKFKDGRPRAIPGHNIPMANMGVLILWLGWFGFNGGSVLSADPEATSLTLVTTCLAAAAGGMGAFFLSTILFRNLDLTMFLNGILGGLVGITAGADQMNPNEAVIIGLIAGLLVVVGITLIDRKLKLDDPVGAIAVHLICGIWGTLAVGIFGQMAGWEQLLYQLAGVGVYAAMCIVSSFIIIFTLKSTVGIRVSEREELEGLDGFEHGMDAYPDFRMNEH
ncbi:ammonium transporter [Aureitalea marina]|uniref:Ammonium transporter n=1 Tax=Aureitalea marina TaxID=930804 RepID=A0A2S7KLW9_9FLAO|nr:ammonium transporter [Aureitalea marina]PQB03625.1 ammonium transporter [Aureitalea marina]